MEQKGRGVLVVDDDSVFASSVELSTHRIGIGDVDAANDLPAALLLLQENLYHVVVLDLDLGARGSGLEVLSWMRKHSPDSSVIVVSAFFSDYLKEMLELFTVVKATFRKPVDVALLARVIASFAQKEN